MPRVILHQPEIPQNTGNIGRLCVATNTPLYLVEPLGFFLDDAQIRRSGLDYWPHLQLQVVPNFATIKQQFPKNRFWFLTTRTRRTYTSVRFQPDDFLVFGSESRGLPEALWRDCPDAVISVPMPGPVRSLNLATTVGIVLYEALRQL